VAHHVSQRDTMFLRLKSCARCDGDLVLDEGEWRCWQCGHYYYLSPLHPEQPFEPSSEPGSSHGHARKGKKRYGGLAERNINSVVRAKNISDEMWWARNRQIIAYLDEGLTVREISMLTARGQRQIRVVRERLAEMTAGHMEATDKL